MIAKYKPILNDMFEFIRNKTTADYSAESIAAEVMKKFKTEIAYYKCEQEMICEFVNQLCEFARFMYTNKLN
jgi:hypothetical protein